MNRDLLEIDVTAVLCGNSDGGVSTLCDDDSPGPLCVLLGAVGDRLSNLLDILSVEVVGLSEGSGLGLVTDQDVDVGENLIERVFEELCNEGSGQVEDEGLRCVS